MRLLTIMALAAVPLTAVPLTGCGEAGAQATVEVNAACASVADGAWESSPWQSDDLACDYLPFEGETTYRFNHDLGRLPRSVDLYVSFTPEGSSVAPPAGDMSRIVGVSDTFVEVRNQTDADFFLRVVLR